MIQAFFYDPICNPVFKFLKQKRYCRYINIYFEKKCHHLKKSPQEAPFVIIVFGLILWFFISLLAKLPIWITEISEIVTWGFVLPFIIAASVAFHTDYSKNEVRLLVYKTLKNTLLLLFPLGLGYICYYQNDEKIIYLFIGCILFSAMAMWIFLLLLNFIVITFSTYINYAYKYVEKDLSAEYVWKVLKNLLYTLITLLILSLFQWILYH